MVLTVTANPTIDRVYFIEDFEVGKLYRVGKVSRSAGGKGINVARVAKIMGACVAAMGFVGGYTGEFIKSEVEKQGIKNLFTDIAGETRTCVNISDDLGRSGEILESGPEISEDEKNKFISAFAEEIENFEVICVSGSLPKGLTGEFYSKLVKIAKEKGKKIVVDTGGDVLEEILSEKPYMVKPNEEEISKLMNKEVKTDEDVKEALLYLYKKGVKIPFVSLGKAGAAAMIDEKYYRFLPPNVSVINAVGSGDSTVAGIATGLDKGYDIINAIKLGMAAGVANTQFEQTGFVTKELTDKYFDQIELKII